MIPLLVPRVCVCVVVAAPCYHPRQTARPLFPLPFPPQPNRSLTWRLSSTLTCANSLIYLLEQHGPNPLLERCRKGLQRPPFQGLPYQRHLSRGQGEFVFLSGARPFCLFYRHEGACYAPGLPWSVQCLVAVLQRVFFLPGVARVITFRDSHSRDLSPLTHPLYWSWRSLLDERSQQRQLQGCGNPRCQVQLHCRRY